MYFSIRRNVESEFDKFVIEHSPRLQKVISAYDFEDDFMKPENCEYTYYCNSQEKYDNIDVELEFKKYMKESGIYKQWLNLDNNEAVFIWYGADADGNEAFLIMTGSIDGDTITLTDTTEATDASGDAKTYTAKLNGKIDTEDSYVEFDFKGADFELSWVMNNISDKQKAQQSVNYIQDGIYGILNTANTKQ